MPNAHLQILNIIGMLGQVYRIRSLANGRVGFTAKDHKKGGAKYTLALSDAEFIRRFSQKRFVVFQFTQLCCIYSCQIEIQNFYLVFFPIPSLKFIAVAMAMTKNFALV